MNHDEELIHRCADGVATPDELAALDARLRDDAELRGRYLDLMNLDTALAAAADVVRLAGTPVSVRGGWLRPYAAAAAGIVLGAFSASMVWAMAVSNRTLPVPEQALPVVNKGFETVRKISAQGMPRRLGAWGGDPCEIVSGIGNVRPHSGDRMLRFRSANSGGGVASGRWACSDLWQVLELPGQGARRVKIRAWFNAETAPLPASFHLTAVAGAGTVTDASKLWKAMLTDSPEVLASGRTVKSTDADPLTWEHADLVLAVPANARLLVVGLAAYRLDAPPDRWFPAQFADDVSVSISDEVQP